MIDVSAICPTYCRPQLLAECIWSYLRQDFGGTSELFILNDNADQVLFCDAPGVRIVNHQKRFATLGEKYNWMIRNSHGHYITPYEDDDIFLPHALSHRVNMMERRGLEYYKLPRAWMVDYGVIKGLTQNLYYCAGMWTRALFDKTNGCAAVQANADQTIERQLSEQATDYMTDDDQRPESVYYIYCWGGRTAHLSGWGNDPGALEKAQDILRRGQPTGKIRIEPGYAVDYEAMVKQEIKGAK